MTMARLATADLVIVGKLTHNARATQRPTDHAGHFAPTLCFEVESLNGLHRNVVQQFFPVGHEEQCEAAARRLLKGMTVSYEVPVTNIVQKHTGVSHVQQVEIESPTTCATQSTPVPAHA